MNRRKRGLHTENFLLQGWTKTFEVGAREEVWVLLTLWVILFLQSIYYISYISDITRSLLLSYSKSTLLTPNIFLFAYFSTRTLLRRWGFISFYYHSGVKWAFEQFRSLLCDIWIISMCTKQNICDSTFYVFADFYHPLQEDELEQSTVVQILFPIDPKPVHFFLQYS